MINLSEVEKTQFRVSFVGSLNKQGHGVKSWKYRLVHITDSRINYFDMACTKKGTVFESELCGCECLYSCRCTCRNNIVINIFSILTRSLPH